MNESDYNQPFQPFDRKTTSYIRVFALILMLIHHTWGFVGRIIEPMPLLLTNLFGLELHVIVGVLTKTCVTIFAFITGYFYAYNKNKTIVTSINKIKGLLKTYWLNLFLLLTPLAYVFGHRMSVGEFILHLFALNPDETILSYAWYVYLFIFAMLVLPFIVKIMNGNWKKDLLYLILIHYVLYLLHFIPSVLPFFWYQVGRNIYTFFPIILVGYYCGRHNIFQLLLDKTRVTSPLIHGIIVGVFLLLRVILVQNQPLHVNFDILITPFILYSLVMAVQPIKQTKYLSKIGFLDKHVTNIWFNHVIFNLVYTAPYLQPIIYYPVFAPFVLIIILAICLPLSIYVNTVDGILTRRVKR